MISALVLFLFEGQSVEESFIVRVIRVKIIQGYSKSLLTHYERLLESLTDLKDELSDLYIQLYIHKLT